MHASPDELVTLAVANDRFTGSAEPLVALALDETRLSAPVRREAADPAPPPGVAAGTLFPHVYGPVELSAVTEVRYARRDPSGRYTSLDRRPATAEALDLVPHPEGGWFRETWRAEPSATRPATRPPGRRHRHLLPAAARRGVVLATVSLGRGVAVALRRAAHPAARRRGPAPAADPAAVTLGPDLAAGQRPQHVVPAASWQSARPAGDREVLVSCVVAPGFDFADFTSRSS